MTTHANDHSTEQPRRSVATLGFRGALALLAVIGGFGLVIAIVNPGA
ncbi:hypothetical protein [Curtobacterium sp. L1-20]